MFESIFDKDGNWEVIELRMLRNRVANLFELLEVYPSEEGEVLAFLMDKEQLVATIAELANKKMILLGTQEGKAIWAEEPADSR